MGQRLVLFGLTAVVLLALVPGPTDARTWTDRRGNQVGGEFVRVHEGLVILLRAGKVGKYPFHEFSEADQDYVREQLEAKGEDHLVPPKVGGGIAAESSEQKPDEPGDPFGDSSGEEEPESEPGVQREWTDRNGRKMQAQFARMSGANVKFIKDGQEVSFPFFDFSIADQNYLKSLLVSLGKESEIPKRSSGAGSWTEGGMSADYPETDGSSFPGGFGGPSGHPSMPRGMGRPASPSYGPGRSSGYSPPPGGMGRSMSPSYDSNSYSGAGMSDLSPDLSTEYEYTPPSYSQPSTPSYTPSPISRPFMPPTSSSASPGGGQQLVHYNYCTKCNEVLPESIGLGDRCPGCGVRFNAEMDENGKITRSAPYLAKAALQIVLGLIVCVVSLVIFVAKVSG